MAIEVIIPNFTILKWNSFKVQIALIEQLHSLSSYIIEKPNDKGYQSVVNDILPLLEESLYD